MPKPDTYRDLQLARLPMWLRDSSAGFGMDAFHAALGDVKDSLVDRIKDAVYARFPLTAPRDALNLIGEERQIPRGANETDALYAKRLQAAWDTWPNAGTGLGMAYALVAAGYPNAVVAQQNRLWFQIDSGGNPVVSQRPVGEWLIDHSPTPAWNRFVVILPPPVLQQHRLFQLTGDRTIPVSGGVDLPQATNLVVANVSSYTGVLTDAFGDIAVNFADGTSYSVNAATFVTDASNPSDVKVDIDATLAAYNTGCPLTGLVLRYPSTTCPTYPLTEAYTGSSVLAPAQDGSNESKRIKALINLWKPASATCSGILVLSSATQVTADYYPAGWTADTQARATADTNADDATHTLWSP